MDIVWFDAYESEHAPRVGGKCSSLGAMTAAGLPVPPGFAITTDAYTLSMERNDVGRKIHNDLAGLDGQWGQPLEVARMQLGIGAGTFYDMFVWVRARIYEIDRNFQRFHIERTGARDAAAAKAGPAAPK